MTYVEELHKKWMKNPRFRTEYEALGPQFDLISALIRARLNSGLTQAEIAERMGTTQSAVARLEGLSSNPSRLTLEKFAKAMGTRLKISFETIDAKSDESEVDAVANDAENGAMVELAEGVEAVTVTS